jgi:hypothetical protein
VQPTYPQATWRGTSSLSPEAAPAGDDAGVIDVTVIDVTDAALRGRPAGRLVVAAAMGRLDAVTDPGHLGLAGPWDDDDGAVWQWLPLGEGDVTVMTGDGGDGKRPWSARQLQALTELGTWWCRQSGQPPRLVRHPGEGGFAVAGPLAGDPVRTLGRTRLAQLADIVMPDVATALRREQAARTPQ